MALGLRRQSPTLAAWPHVCPRYRSALRSGPSFVPARSPSAHTLRARSSSVLALGSSSATVLVVMLRLQWRDGVRGSTGRCDRGRRGALDVRGVSFSRNRARLGRPRVSWLSSTSGSRSRRLRRSARQPATHPTDVTARPPPHPSPRTHRRTGHPQLASGVSTVSRSPPARVCGPA